MLKKFIILKILFVFFTTISFAEVIKDVKIFGNKRLSKESIVVLGGINFNQNYEDTDLNNILKDIYKTNFFKKIDLNINNSILEISVIENPIIEDIQVNGIKSKKLTELFLNKTNLKDRSPYIESLFLSDLNLIKNAIKNNGYYFAEIKTSSILNEKKNSIRLTYDVNLGKRAKIQKIQFIGDKKIKDRKLKNIIASEESKFWKFISQSTYLNPDRINLDKRLLSNFYKNNGYYNAEITNSFVEFNDDASFKLIFNINAGNKFKFNDLNLILADDYDKKYFTKIEDTLNELKNQYYSLNKIEKILREVDKIALTKQYQFIGALLEEKIVDNDKLNISISLSDNEKFYVEKINIFGNNYTIEEVIRDSLIVDEGDPYNEILFNKSINNIKSKNIFSNVKSDIFPGSNQGLKIVNLTVEEKPTGEISLGAGVGTSGGTVGGGIKENNFLGKGIRLDTNLEISDSTIKGQFVYVKPNFNNSDNSLFTSLKSTNTDNIAIYGYKTSNVALSLGTSFEQFENLFFKPAIDLSYEKLTTTNTASAARKKQHGNYFDAYLSYSFDYDQRDSTYRAEEGYRNTFYQELPIISENYEILNSFQTSRYQKISEMVTKVSFYGKVINTLNNKDVRISKRLFMPGSKLRGFEVGKIGPMDNSDYIGGNYISSINFSATLPKFLPSLQSMDFSIFVDAANVWGVDYDSSKDVSSIRSATGIAMDIATPVGPLNFSLSQPITKSSSDKTESFRFNLGTTF
jgi:outer membrane protein insertion porin family